MKKIQIITHRGLDPEKPNFFPESSKQAFLDHLTRGYGIEFDVQFTHDNQMVVQHDAKNISDMSLDDLLQTPFGRENLITLPDLLEMIQNKSSTNSISAFHIKSQHQSPEKLDLIIQSLEVVDPSKIILFDLKPESAQYIKENSKKHFEFAASVAHSYDIERYNTVVGETLLTIEELLNNPVFTWAWLDEWDRTDKNGAKSLYTSDTCKKLKDAGMKIAIVSPELHATSPGLLGGESHPDAQNRETLTARLNQIISLNPDAVCTDYPDYVQSLL